MLSNIVAGNLTNWGRGEGLPDAPTLIVAPATLVSQWINELRRFFQLHSVNIFVCKQPNLGHAWVIQALNNYKHDA